jgi:hypothetical protein
VAGALAISRKTDFVAVRAQARRGRIEIVKEGSARPKGGLKGGPEEKTSSGKVKSRRGFSSATSFPPAISSPRMGFAENDQALKRASDGCLGAERRRRTWQAAISSGEALAPFDPEISEWGNPPLRSSNSLSASAGGGFGRSLKGIMA